MEEFLGVWCQIYYIGVVQGAFSCQAGSDANIHFHEYKRRGRWTVNRGYCW